MEPPDSKSSSSDGEGNNVPEQAPDTPEKRLVGPLAQPVATNVRFDAVGGAYGSKRAPAGGSGAIAIPKAPQRAKGPSWQAPKRPFTHQRCRLRSYPHVFVTCSGLNVHSTLQHG